jgi:hypothetical protein
MLASFSALEFTLVDYLVRQLDIRYTMGVEMVQVRFFVHGQQRL